LNSLSFYSFKRNGVILAGIAENGGVKINILRRNKPMENSRRSLTFKVIVGYLLVAILAGAAVWYTYNQVVTFTEVTQSNSLSNQQLVLVSEIATELYETESMGRRFIQSGDTTDLRNYNLQIEDIQTTIRFPAEDL
jgi:hypothetical protein